MIIVPCFRNEQRIQADHFNKTLETERNKAAAEKIALQDELRNKTEELTAQKTQSECVNVYLYNCIRVRSM